MYVCVYENLVRVCVWLHVSLSISTMTNHLCVCVCVCMCVCVCVCPNLIRMVVSYGKMQGSGAMVVNGIDLTSPMLEHPLHDVRVVVVGLLCVCVCV